jgi:hypothetical protein
MKRFGLFAVLAAGLVLLALGCSEDRVTAPSTAPSAETALDAQSAAYELASTAGWPIEAETAGPARASTPLGGSAKCVVRFERQVITQNIVHYTWRIRTGGGPYDVIGLHRVVKEARPNRPHCASLNLFYQHGSSKDFVGMMLPGLTSPATPDDFGLAVYLARNGVDVWGIDQAWTLVPAGVTDTDFMAHWGIARQSTDLRTAVTLARAIRMLTGCGCAKMNLAGYSNGVFSSVAVVNEETQLPEAFRQVGAYIPIDAPIKTNEPAVIGFLAGYLDGFYTPEYEAGHYAETVYFAPMAQLVRCCPNDPSPFYPDLTNLQYALVSCCSPWFTVPASSFHYWAPALDESGMPTGLLYTDSEMWLDFLASGTAYEPIIWGVEWISYCIDRLDTPYDDHLGEISVPILNLTPAGGFDQATEYGLSLLGSTDIQTIRPAIGGGVPAVQEFGHIDMFTAPQAPALMWEPLLSWLRTHSAGAIAIAD